MFKGSFIITGAQGQLGSAFVKALQARGAACRPFSRLELDISDSEKLSSVLKELKPSVVINCAAFNYVDLAQTKPEETLRVNFRAVQTLAEICRQNNIFLIHYSSDYVFDGKKGALYNEEDAPAPLSQYGQSKLEGERAVQSLLRDYLLMRVSWVFGAGGENFLTKATAWAGARKEIRIADDEVSAPTLTDDIVASTLAALDKGATGLYHASNSGFCSRFEWVRFFFEKMRFDNTIIPVPSSTFNLAAPRPRFSAMSNRKLSKDLKIAIPAWQDAVERFIQQP